ncbi:hypothetical protein Val02_47710 [Virgisporangium aliadipatigenens]|uniref:Uncharacterized protein n=1 Tax=Virgisporangium aliadipatigenens TaxID=741659 RepID=A0A8J3YQ19_9ACTN|nr:hypothetical protein [Virgisporangium aliadipatigenens]GIJ47885.1 hypothetical protein Val02_47710 [Virgisporangium aliadipatigenens]
MNLRHYALLVRGRLDAATRALFAEYDLDDEPVDIALYDLPMREPAMDALLTRAEALGIRVIAVERGER